LQIGEDDNIHVELPRATVGGLKKGPVEDLLRRIARDYAKLEAENNRLLQTLEQIEPVAVEADTPVGEAPAAPDQETSALPNAVGLEQGNGHRAEHVPLDPWSAAGPANHAPRKERDDLASAVLTMAQRAARELRESTRDECELIIRKTRSHARKLELELEHTRAVTSAELDELRALKQEMREHMRSSLQVLLQAFADEGSGEMPEIDWTDESGFGLYAESDETPHKKKNKKSKS
jgi:cell division septum initiation protein DivIVA